MQDGLPDQTITCFTETPDHYLWLGTPRSLVRFDGWRFVDASSDIDPQIHDFGVTSVYTARDGSLWIGTGAAKVLHLTRKGVEKFGSEKGLGAYNVHVLQEDTSGVLWAGTDHGIFRFEKGSFHRLLHVGDPSVHALIQDGSSGLWFGGRRLIHFSQGALQDVLLPKQKVAQRIETLARTSDGTIWIGTLGGLLRLDSGSEKSPRPVLPYPVKSLLVDRKQRLWVGTVEGGLFQLQANGSFVRFAQATASVSETVLALRSDDSEDIWMGTRSGLVRLSNTGMHILPLTGVRKAEHATLSLDKDGSVWICAGKATHIVEGRAETPKLPQVGGLPIRAVLRDRTGAFWIGTAGGGALRISRDGRIERYAAKIGTSYVSGLIQGRNSDVWIATESGVARWRDGEIVSFQHSVGAPHQPVLSLAVVEDGVWIGTAHGLFRLRGDAFVSDPAAQQLGLRAIRSLYVSADGALWIGAEQGLFRWKKERLAQAPLETYGESPAVLSIFEDAEGRLWLSSPANVRRIKREAVERFLDAEKIGSAPPQKGKGLAPEVFAVLRETGAVLEDDMQAAAADGKGGAWYLNDQGLLHIDGQRRLSQRAAPPVVLERVVVDGAKAPLEGELVLAPSTKTLELKATPIVLGARSGLQIRRKLLGFDTDWSPLSSSQTVTYTNLPPGRYTYRVEAQWPNSDRVSAVELHIEQQAHFYLRWWFLLLCAILVAFVVWLLHRQKLSRVAAEFRAVAEERNRVAREMHDTLLQGCIGVSSLLEGMAITQEMQQKAGASSAPPQKWTAALQLARSEMERTIREARVAIWGLRSAEAEASLDCALRELLKKVTESSSIRTSFRSSGSSATLSRNEQRELLMAAREALQNSVKHAAPRKVTLHLRYSPKLVSVIVADDGRGIVGASGLADGEQHFGVVGMQERMERIGGVCRIETVSGVGTTITFDLPVATP